MGCSRSAISNDQNEFEDFIKKYLPERTYNVGQDMPPFLCNLIVQVYNADYELVKLVSSKHPDLRGADLIKLTLAHKYIQVVEDSLDAKKKRYAEYLKLKQEFE